MDSIVRWLKQELLAYIDPGVPDDDYEHMVSVSHCNILRWFDALDRLSAQQREPVVRVKELEWTSVFGRPATRAESLSSIGLYIIADLDGTERFSVGLDNGACAAFLLDEAGNKQLRYSSIHEAVAAAQADYEQRIMAAIEITRSDHTSKSTAARTDAGKTGVTAGETATTSDGGSPGPSPLAVDPFSSDPASGRSQPSPNVSVDELADFIDQLDILSIVATADDEAVEIARALLAHYRIERLGCLPSGRR